MNKISPSDTCVLIAGAAVVCECNLPAVVQPVGTLSSRKLKEQHWKAQKACYVKRAVVCVGDR